MSVLIKASHNVWINPSNIAHVEEKENEEVGNLVKKELNVREKGEAHVKNVKKGVKNGNDARKQ